MKIAFDLNVLIDVACRWQEFPDSLELYNRVVQDPGHEGAVPGCGYTTLYYVLKQAIPEPSARAFLSRFSQTLGFLPFEQSTAEVASRLAMADLEDACLAASALEARCDLIATRDLEGFAASPVRAETPAKLLRRLTRT
jgi:hypothetical protein